MVVIKMNKRIKGILKIIGYILAPVALSQIVSGTFIPTLAMIIGFFGICEVLGEINKGV